MWTFPAYFSYSNGAAFCDLLVFQALFIYVPTPWGRYPFATCCHSWGLSFPSLRKLLSNHVHTFLTCVQHSQFKVLLIKLARLLTKMLLPHFIRWTVFLPEVLSPQSESHGHKRQIPVVDSRCSSVLPSKIHLLPPKLLPFTSRIEETPSGAPCS